MYTENEIIQNLKQGMQDISTLYTNKILNYRGKTSDTNTKYTEIITKELLNLDIENIIKTINEIKREKSYKVATHEGKVSDSNSNRKEERFAIELFNRSKTGKKFNTLGSIVDYQVPLKNKQDDKAGKIDLISKTDNNIYIIELKIKESQETLLRSILEISTYYETLSKDKFIEDYEDFKGLSAKNIKKAVLISKDSLQHKEYISVLKGKQNHLKNLIKKLNVEIHIIDESNLEVLNNVYVVFHGGGKEIGGNCIEVIYNNQNILLDAGISLTNPVQSNIDLNNIYDGILISHAHIDHYGLLNNLSRDTDVYISEATKDICEINRIFLKQKEFIVNYNIFKSYTTFNIGDFEIRPFLQDHSAFDSHGFIIKINGKTIMYTGDFRNHGRKPFIYKKSIDIVKDSSVDLLITEGTTLNRKNIKVKTEEDILKEFIDAIEKSNKAIVLYFSPQNIDRFVSIYKATRTTKRKLVIDIYSAYLLYKLSKYAKIPTIDYKDIFVYYPNLQRNLLIHEELNTVVSIFNKKKISIDTIKENPEKYVIMTRPSMFNELEDIEVSTFIYSLWEGYLEKKPISNMKDYYINNGANFKIIHTSGHASPEFFKRYINSINPKNIKIIHTEGINSEYKSLDKYSHSLAQNGDVVIL